MRNNNEKGIITIIFLVVAGLAIVSVIAYFILQQSKSLSTADTNQAYSYSTTGGSPLPSIAPIREDADFTKVAADFDATDTIELDNSLKQLETDANF